jgi:hypothetical protein
MNAFYINLADFDKHEIGQAAGKAFRFTELICETENPYGFVLHIEIEKTSSRNQDGNPELTKLRLSTVAHTIFSNRKTHFGFEAHDAIRILSGCRLFVRIMPAGQIIPCKSKLLCELDSIRL